MRTLVLPALLATGAALVAAAGCSPNVTEMTGAGGSSTSSSATSTATTSSSTGGGSGGAVTSSSSSSVVASSSSTTTSSSTGTGGGNPHGSFATAGPINIGVTLMEDLPNGDSDYFVFTGTKGQAIDIEAVAQYLDSVNPAPYDPTYLDTVVSLYDANQQKIAEDNDIPYDGNDADLFTVLPADGTYYVRVTECWTWSAESGKKCAAPQQKTHTQYELLVYAKDPSQANVSEDPVPDTGNTSATATAFKFTKNGATQYYKRSDVFGFFDNATDVDWFSFDVPADAPVNKGRLAEYILFQLPGAAHDGSTEGVGTVTVVDATTKVVASVSGSTGQIVEVPVTAGQTYFVSLSRNDGLVGSNDFYAFFAYSGGSNLLEMNDAGNNTRAGAEPMTAVMEGAGEVAYFPAGDLTPAGTDVDWFSAAVPANLPAGSMMQAACDGQFFGSGLRGLTATLTDGSGTVLASGTETANLYAYTPVVAVPAGAATIFLEVSATSQDAVNTGTYYACGVYFLPP